MSNYKLRNRLSIDVDDDDEEEYKAEDRYSMFTSQEVSRYRNELKLILNAPDSVKI